MLHSKPRAVILARYMLLTLHHWCGYGVDGEDGRGGHLRPGRDRFTEQKGSRMKMLDVPQSGSVAGVTSSRNRYGQYRRTRATPVNPNTTAQGTVRNRLSVNAAAWRLLTSTQRAGWADLAASMNRTDSLGQTNTLTGFGAYVSVNNNQLAAGNAVLSDAPALVTPSGLITAVLTLAAASLSLAYTPTPLGAGARAFLYASVQRSAGRNYESDYRLIRVSTAAQASPLVALTEYAAKFGTPIVGNRIFFKARVYTGGFLSGPLDFSQIVA
jgi:hypothetical protein